MHRTPLAILLALLLLLAACGDGEDAELSVDDLDDEPAEDVEEDDSDEDTAPDPDEDDGEADEDEDEDGPRPDPSRVENPCAEWEGQEMESFLDVVAPVDGQSVGDTVELVGCANVPEGTVRYRVTAEDGTTVADDFTTAECGGPCVGEYEAEVDLAEASSGQALTLEVFWDSPADGSEQERTEVELEVE